ncbi:DUF6785 family protein [Halomonas sp.]|uniref:DUF6785 family protein n=1 Tax=Halomonas sp. TaxID=1486246 RepID=UPI003D0D1B7C
MRETAGAAVTARAVVLSLLTAGAVGFLFPWANLVIRGSRPANTSLPFGVIAIFFVLVALLNPALRLLGPRLALRRDELLVIFVAALLAASVVTWGLVGQLLPIMTGVSYYATAENHWEELFARDTVPWVAVTDTAAARQFYESSPVGVPWRAWLGPLGAWAIFVAALAAASLGLMILVQRRWIEHERLVYPLMYLPIEMVREETSAVLLPALLRNRLFWIGVLAALVPVVAIGLRHYYPVVPPLKLRNQVAIVMHSERLTLRLWTNFSVVAFAYLINADLGFSLWCFALLSAFETPLLRLAGVGVGAKEIYSSGSQVVSNQAMGAMIFLVAASLWSTRAEIGEAFRSLAGIDAQGRERGLRAAGAVCLAVGLTGMIWWLTASGLPVVAAVLLVFAAMVTFTALTRAAVQGGVPVSRAALIPQSFVLHALGSHALGPRGITALAYSFAWCADIRVFLMPFAAHGLKVWDEARVSRRGFLPLAATTLAVALVVSTITTLVLAYTRGGVSLSSWLFDGCPRAAFNYAAAARRNPITFSASWWAWMALGGVLMAGLNALHMRFIGWPLHPLGYAIAPTQPVQDLWFSILIGWVIKSAALRYGGYRVYDSGIRVMLGLILGQFLGCAGWLVVDAITGTTGNMIFVY